MLKWLIFLIDIIGVIFLLVVYFGNRERTKAIQMQLFWNYVPFSVWYLLSIGIALMTWMLTMLFIVLIIKSKHTEFGDDMDF